VRISGKGASFKYLALLKDVKRFREKLGGLLPSETESAKGWKYTASRFSGGEVIAYSPE